MNTDAVRRDLVYRAQTPQSFRLPDILKAHEKALKDGFAATDDASVAERAGMKVVLVEGSSANNKITTSTLSGIAQLLRQFSDKREGLIWMYLLSLADDEGKVDSSVNAMALQLNMHRQTLSRFIKHLCDQGYATWEIKGSSRQPNVLRITALATGEATTAVTEDVTTVVTEERTTFVTENATVHTTPDNSAMRMKPEGYENEDSPYATTDVTTDATTDATTDVTEKREKNKRKKKIPLHPLKKKKNKKKIKTHTQTRAHARKSRKRKSNGAGNSSSTLSHPISDDTTRR